jgi:signal transduction histidine kinase
MDERTPLLAICAEPAALVDRSGAIIAANERLQVALGRDRSPTTLALLLDGFLRAVVRPNEVRAAVEDAVRAGRTLRRYAASADPDADDLEVLVLPDARSPEPASLVVLRQPARRAREEVLARRHDRLALLGQVAAEAGHELNNVLTAVIGWSHLLAHPRDGADAAEVASRARLVESAALKAQRIVADLMGMARGQEERSSANVAATVREVLRMTSGEAARRAITVKADVPEDLDVRLRRVRLSQVLLNLVRNAMQAIRQGGNVRIAARADGGSAVVRVEDDGPGMDAATLARAFEPFFTTRRGDVPGEDPGTGLGLPLSRRIVEQEGGGSIRISSTVGTGTAVELRLPLSPLQQVQVAEAGRAELPAPPADFSLLVVERDAEVAEYVVEALHRMWNVVPVAVSGIESACQALRARPFAVALLDGDADPDGPESALSRLRAVRPELRAVLACGRDSWAGFAAPATLPVAGRLHKPYSLPELLQALSAAAKTG